MKKVWEIKKLSEVADVFNGGTPDTKVPRYWNGDLLWITPKDMGKSDSLYVGSTERKITEAGLKNSSANLLPTNSVILSSRAPIGYLAINEKPISFNQGCKGIVPKAMLSPLFLYYFLRNSIELLNDLGVGATFKELSAKKLSDVQIPLPPLSEQKSIVEILGKTVSAIGKAKAKTEKNLQDSRALFKSYLQAYFNARDGWKETTLSEVVDSKCTLSYGIVQPGNDFSGGLPIVRPTDLTRKFIPLNGLKLIKPSLADSYKRTTLSGKELLLCVRGTTGTVSISTHELKGANVTRGIVPIRFNDEVLSLEFGYYLFISAFVQNQIKEKTYGAALMQINIGDIRKIRVAIPSVAEQNRIVKILDRILDKTRQIEILYQHKLQILEELNKSLFKKAFDGKLSTLSKIYIS